jgi:hypothetical protein
MLKALHPTTAAAAATTESFILVPVLQELSKWRTQAPTGKRAVTRHVMHADTAVCVRTAKNYSGQQPYYSIRTSKWRMLALLLATPCISLLRPIMVQYCKRTTHRASSKTHKNQSLDKLL